jgi:hypothetical protein
MNEVLKSIMTCVGGIVGWAVGTFQPTIPLFIVAMAFIVYDSWTAYELDKRVKIRYPDKKKRPAKYVSFKAWKMIPRMIESSTVILLMFLLQKWVFVDVYVPLSYIATGVVCGVQLLSIAENKCSCRTPQDKGYKIWKVMALVLIDKTERHFDTDLGDLKEDIKNISETD